MVPPLFAQATRGKKGGKKSTSGFSFGVLAGSPAQAQAQQHAASSAAVSTAATGSGKDAKDGAASSKDAVMALLLGGKPLVPSMLNGIVAAFNPRISIASASSTSSAGAGAGGGGGKPSMAQVRRSAGLVRGGMGGGGL